MKAVKAKNNGSFRVVSLNTANFKMTVLDVIHNASLVNRP